MLMGAKNHDKKEASKNSDILSYEQARKQCADAITSGRALDKLAEFVKAQGGDAQMIYNPDKLPKARYIEPVYMEEEGYLSECKTSEVGMVSLILGGGRETKESKINLAVGIDIKKHLGDYVKKGDVFAYIHSDDKGVMDEAKARLLNAYKISDIKKEPEKIVKDIVY